MLRMASFYKAAPPRNVFSICQDSCAKRYKKDSGIYYLAAILSS